MKSGNSTTTAMKKGKFELVHDLKKKLVANYGVMIISFPCMEETLPKILKSDDAETKAEKKSTIDRILCERETEYLDRKDELMDELENIITRVKRTVDESKVSIESLYSVNDARGSTILARLPKRCSNCGNDDPNNVIEQRGETVCLGLEGKGTCGMVIIDHVTSLGAEKRNFEGEEDRNHFGPAPNSLMPDAFNMQTNFAFIEKGNTQFKKLHRTQQTLEMNLSNIAHEDHRTREHYKSLQKQKAFNMMKDIAPMVSVPPLAVSRASEIFALYRHIKEAVQNFEAVVLSCLVIAYEELADALAQDNEQIQASKALTQQLQQRKDLQSLSSSSATTTHPKRHDPAVETHSSLQISRFDLQQLRDWLLAVSNASTEDVEVLQICSERLVQQAERDLQSVTKSTSKTETSRESSSATSAAVVNQNGKRQRDISAMTEGIFGTTTMAGRYEQLKLRPKSTDNIITAGKVFLKMNIAKVIRQQPLQSNDDSNSGSSTAASAITIEDPISDKQYSKVTDTFRNAISRRTKADAGKKQEELVHEQERRKQQLEYYSFDHQTKRPRIEPKPETTTVTTTAMEVGFDNDDFNLEDLVGGPISIIRGAPPPQTSAVQPEAIVVKEEIKQSPPASQSNSAMDGSPPSDAMASNIADDTVAEVPLAVKVKGKPKKAPKVVFS